MFNMPRIKMTILTKQYDLILLIGIYLCISQSITIIDITYTTISHIVYDEIFRHDITVYLNYIRIANIF